MVIEVQTAQFRKSMQMPARESEITEALDQVLGYLNFSSGSEDKAFLGKLNQLFEYQESLGSSGNSDSTHQQVLELLGKRLESLKETNSTFADSQQAHRVLDLMSHHVLPGYMAHHRDLLFHRTDTTTFNSFFIGRIFESVLASKPIENEAKQIIKSVNSTLNDFIGHRPVPSLETQKIEPYPNEWVRPIPVYIKDVGTAHGKYNSIINKAIELLRTTPDDLLEISQFDPEHLDELALDPRAFDFDHPVNRRPNYHFGQWDEHSIDNHGYFNRFIIHEVTLDALLSRLESKSEISDEEILLEASTVLAGTILMASGISGRGPGAYDSRMTLSLLLPRIAGYRDEFYERLLQSVPDKHRERLVEETKLRHQSFGGARQHLNTQLAIYRSEQLVRVQLATLFARMGFQLAANRQSRIVPVASGRMLCQIDCWLAQGRIALRNETLDEACRVIPRIMDVLQRGIHCGAIIDPWNILGFDANYSLFPASENSVRDHRADELVDLMDHIINYCSRIWITAAARGDQEICQRIGLEFDLITDWWRQYAPHEVSSVDTVEPLEIYNATKNVASALTLWQENVKEGTHSNPIEFWSRHVELFHSPRAFALAIIALINRQDYSTSMGLLIFWLGRSDEFPLEYGATSYGHLVGRWLQGQFNQCRESDNAEQAAATWNQLRKFYDYLEANANDNWRVPRFDLNRNSHRPTEDVEMEEFNDESADDSLYSAAYESMVYKDTTDDGVDGSIDDGGGSDDESEALRLEAERISFRLNFLETLADLFKVAATIIPVTETKSWPNELRKQTVQQQISSAQQWAEHAKQIRRGLDELTATVENFRLPVPRCDQFSMIEYDRLRYFKESLLDQVVSISVEFANARRMLIAWSSALQSLESDNGRKGSEEDNASSVNDTPDDELSITQTFANMFAANRKEIQTGFENLTEQLAEKPILYVPLSKGGKCEHIFNARVRQCAMGELLDCLPRLGLFQEGYELTRLILLMERNQRSRVGAVTEFDELFRISYTSMLETLIEATETLKQNLIEQGTSKRDAAEQSESALFECMELLTESMLMIWLSHSRTLRLSVLERISDRDTWDQLKSFIETYGEKLFTQTFFNMANIRAILHQGVDQWLTQMAEEPNANELRLFHDLESNTYPRKKAISHLTLILEAIQESYSEYRDYNSTTTQSDRGELLYILIDFLQLRAKYDRVCWHLKPVIWAHETLVRNKQNSVARLWRRSLTERVGSEADRFVAEYDKLKNRYSIQMASIEDRLNEKFVHPMQVDRLCSLVETAMVDPNSHHSQRIFDLIEHQADSMARRPNGSGIDVPSWIIALSEEVDHVAEKQVTGINDPKPLVTVSPIPISELREQIEQLPRRQA